MGQVMSADICVALDYKTANEALAKVDELKDHVTWFKVGLELFTREGPELVKQIKARGVKVFLDLKFYDIPHTVKMCSQSVADLGVDLFNVHASAGLDVLKAAKEGAQNSNNPQTKVIAVTLLTSSNGEELKRLWDCDEQNEQVVLNLATETHKAELNGVVCSAQEAKMLRKEFGDDFLLVCPGIRPEWAIQGDQKRITTPKQAKDNGANLLVIGRPITQAEDSKDAVAKILQELNSVIPAKAGI